MSTIVSFNVATESSSSSSIHRINLNYFVDTHALVQFMEDYTSSIVPLERLEKNQELCVGESCFVRWSNGKKYGGTLICSGNQPAV